MPPLNTFSRTGIALAIAQTFTLQTHAVPIKVNDSSDISLADDTSCTLREAIKSANTSVDQNNGCTIGSISGTDTITFSNSLASNTITLENSKLRAQGKNFEVNASNISGGITIDADHQPEVLLISNLSVLTFDSITFTGGSAQGGIRVFNSTVNLDNSTVSGNSTEYSFSGGGIYANNSTVNLTNSVVSDNTSALRGGGVYGRSSSHVSFSYSEVSSNLAASGGGGISLSGSGSGSGSGNSLTFNNSRLSNNSSPKGGAGLSLLDGARGSFHDSTVDNNMAGFGGGGIIVESFASLSITNSSIVGNFSSRSGGAIELSNNGRVSFFSSTLSSNSAAFNGGAISIGTSSSVALTNSTVSNNSATNKGGGMSVVLGSDAKLINSTMSENSSRSNGGGGIYANDAASKVSLNNSIIANSLIGGDCFVRAGTVTTYGSTIVEDFSCNARRNGDPGLLPLADNGGPTLTHALEANSIAIDTGNPLTCEAYDQRGDLRDAQCNVGSFELFMPRLTLQIDADSVSESAGPSATTGTVSRNSDTASPLTVSLVSSDTTEVIVPATVTIAAGQSISDPFNIDAIDDSLTDDTQNVTITASANAHDDGVDTIDVTDEVTYPFYVVPLPNGKSVIFSL